jgi:hypothetical protein
MFKILILLILTSCSLFEKSKYYDEEITNFYSSKENDLVFFLGKKYHYIFDEEHKDLQRVLLWSGAPKIMLDKQNSLILYDTGVIQGNVTFFTDVRALSQVERGYLLDLGFSYYEKNSCIIQNKLYLNGAAFTPNPILEIGLRKMTSSIYKLRIKKFQKKQDLNEIHITPLKFDVKFASINFGTDVKLSLVPFNFSNPYKTADLRKILLMGNTNTCIN